MNRREFSVALAAVGSGLFPPWLRAATFDTKYLDARGLIVQSNGDAGDTAQREGWAWFGIWIRQAKLAEPWEKSLPLSFQNTIALLEIDESGLFRRHPDQWNDDKDFSRDQQIPIVASLGVWGLRQPLDRLFRRLKDRGWRCQNGDIAGADHLNLFARAQGRTPSVLGDVQLMGMSAIIAMKTDPDDVGDDLNHIVNLLQASFIAPSAYSLKALNLYAKNRPISFGCYLQTYRAKFGFDPAVSKEVMIARIRDGIASGWTTDCPRVLGALRWYFRLESGGNPELAELYDPVVRAYLS